MIIKTLGAKQLIMTFTNMDSISDYNIHTIIPRRTALSTMSNSIDTFDIQQRRYLGNKFNVLSLIDEVINNEIGEYESFCDIFGGTGSVGHHYNRSFNKIIKWINYI